MATSIQSRVLSNLESLIYSGIQSKNLRIAEMTVQTCTSILSDKDDVLKNFERLKSSLHSLGQSASQSSCSLLPDLCAKNESKETCPPECSANDCGNTENLRYMTPQSQQELQAPVSDLKKEQLSTPQVVIKINNSSKACGENKSKNSNFKSNKKAVLLETCDIALDNSLASESPLIIACSSGSQVLKDMCQSDEHEMGSISDSGICSKLYFDPELPANAIAAPNNEISNSKFQSTPVASDKNSPVPESFSLISLTHENNKDIDPLLCYKEKGLEISSVDSFSISKAPISQSQFSLQNINLNFFKNIEKQPNLDCTMQDFICTVQNPQEMSTQDSTISHEIRKFKCKNSFHELSNNSDSVTARLLTSPKETRSQNMVTPETASTSGRPSNENSIDYKCNTLDQPVIETPIGNEHEDTTNDGQCTHNSSVLEDEALGIKINLLHVGTHLKKNMNDSVAEIEKSNELNIDEVQNIHSKDCAPCHDPKTLKVSNDLEHSLYVDTTKSDFSILPPLPNKLKTNAESTVLGKDSSYELTASLPVGEDSKALCSPTAEDRPNKKNLKSLGKRSCVSSPVKRPCRKSAREIPQKSTYRSCRNTLNSSEKDKKKMIHDGLDNLVRSPKPNDISVSPSSNISTRLRSNLRSNVRKRKACKDDETQFTRNQSNPLHSEQIGLKRRRVTRSSLTKDVVNKIYNQNVSVELDMPEFSTNNKPSINNLSNVAKSDNEKNNGEAAMEGSMINLKRKIIHEIGVKQISLVDFESPESIQEDSGSLVLTDEHPNEKNISHNKTIINAPIDGQSWPTNTIENQYKNINAKENTVGIEEQHEILYSDKSNFKSSAMNFLIRNSSTNLSSPNGSSTAKAVDAMQSEDMCKDIFESINFLITALQKSKLCKNVVGLIEDKMMDAKRELYEAERRGRSSH